MYFTILNPRILRLFKIKQPSFENNVIISNLLIIFLILVYKFSYNFMTGHGAGCLVLKYLGFPCPGCGVSRGMFNLLDGDIVTSLRYNPGSFLILLFIAFQIASIIMVKNMVLSQSRALLINKIFYVIIILALLVT